MINARALLVTLTAFMIMTPAMAQKADIDMRGMDTLGGSNGGGSGQPIVQFQEQNLSVGPKLDLSDPLLADTLGTSGSKDQGLCSSAAGGCNGLSGGDKLSGDTLN